MHQALSLLEKDDSVNRLEKLIQQLCPNGVEWTPLGNVIISLNTGLNPRQFFKLNTEDATNYYVTIKELRNDCVVFSDKTDRINETALILCNNRANLEVDDVLFSGTGTIGETAIITAPPTNWNIKEGVYSIKPNKAMIEPRFLMYLLKTERIRKQFLSKAVGGTVKSIPMGELKTIIVPLPPLEVQREIVRILDQFTELTAELTARKKQYEYYRDELLHKKSFHDIRECRLGEVADIHTGCKPDDILEEHSEFEYINAGTTNSGYVKTPNCPGDTVTTPSRGQGGIGFVGYQSQPFHLGPLCYSIRSSDENIITNKFIYYWLSSHTGDILAFKKEGGTPALNRGDLMGLRLCVPHISVQHRIVSILDRFDALCNDLTSGLPAEIEARRKQYEYYRDKLLTFQEKH